MAIDESQLTKGQQRKLNALGKSVGDALGDEVFTNWLARQQEESASHGADPLAERIEQALAGFADDRSLNLGRYGYTIRRARGKGNSGFVATKNDKARPGAAGAIRETPSAERRWTIATKYRKVWRRCSTTWRWWGTRLRSGNWTDS